MHQYYVYILANQLGRIYIGVTNDLRRRVWEHRRGGADGYTRAYGIHRLIYFEQTSDVRAAIAREKQLKRWPRWRKDRLIEQHNHARLDLSAEWVY